MDDKVWAVLGLVACGLVWGGMAAGPARLRRWRAQALAGWRTLRLRLGRPGRTRDAQREAADAIERARRARPGVERDGNVYRPEAFDGKRGDRDRLH